MNRIELDEQQPSRLLQEQFTIWYFKLIDKYRRFQEQRSDEDSLMLETALSVATECAPFLLTNEGVKRMQEESKMILEMLPRAIQVFYTMKGCEHNIIMMRLDGDRMRVFFEDAKMDDWHNHGNGKWLQDNRI